MKTPVNKEAYNEKMKTPVSINRRKKTGVIGRNRRVHRKRSLCREYRKLRSLLPTGEKGKSLSQKIGVVDAAYKYIRQLQTALVDKFSNRTIPPDLAEVVGNEVKSTDDVRSLAIHIIQQNQKNNNNNTDIADRNYSDVKPSTSKNDQKIAKVVSQENMIVENETVNENCQTAAVEEVSQNGKESPELKMDEVEHNDKKYILEALNSGEEFRTQERINGEDKS